MVEIHRLARLPSVLNWIREFAWLPIALALTSGPAYAGDVQYVLASSPIGFGGHELWQTPEVDLIRLPEAEALYPEIQRVSTFAALQPPVPPPDIMGVVPEGDVNREAAPEGLQGTAQESPPGGAQTPQEPIGQAPQDNRLNFLRSATVLLQPGQMQFDWGVRYTWRDFSHYDFALPFTLRNRQLVSPFAIRYGLTPRIQLFANLPLGFAIGERADPAGVQIPGRNTFKSVFGMADTSAGVTYLIQKGQCDEPDIIGTVGFVAPTGHHPFENITDPLRTDPTPISGSGFWGVNANVTFIKTYDPAVIFGNLGYSHLFARTFGDGINGATVWPGESFTYGLGMGFAINDRLTLSTIYQGAFQTRTVIDQTQFGIARPRATFNLEPMVLRTALTATVNPRQIVEPFVIFGLNRDAPEADIGVTSTHTY